MTVDDMHNASPVVEKRHYSIDLSLELENQLALDYPPTPAKLPTPPQQQRSSGSLPTIPGMPFQMPDIDPQVLAHIITQLRHQLADMTKERDDLVALLTQSHTKEAELQDALQHITDKAMVLDEKLSDARKKNRDDEEAISLLRTKVEESRRGLMRLQAESRRAQPLDIARANAPSSFMGAPASSKRASFTPLTGTFAANSFVPSRPNGHRRISSVSDSNVAINLEQASPVDPSRSLTIAAAPPPPANRRLSGFFNRSSPPQPQHLQLSRSPSPPGPSSDEIEKLRKELSTLKAELEETRGELAEATEAREAAETCAGALREFIAENNVGSEGAVKLPPLPAATTGNEPDTESTRQQKGWSFKLWKLDTAAKPESTPTQSPVIAPAEPAPLTRKLTGFFGGRTASISSLGPLQLTGPPQHVHRDSVYSVSDASSVAEPISPTSQMATADVRVQDAAGGSPDLAERARAEEESKVQTPRLADDELGLL